MGDDVRHTDAISDIKHELDRRAVWMRNARVLVAVLVVVAGVFAYLTVHFAGLLDDVHSLQRALFMQGEVQSCRSSYLAVHDQLQGDFDQALIERDLARELLLDVQISQNNRSLANLDRICGKGQTGHPLTPVGRSPATTTSSTTTSLPTAAAPPRAPTPVPATVAPAVSPPAPGRRCTVHLGRRLCL